MLASVLRLACVRARKYASMRYDCMHVFAYICLYAHTPTQLPCVHVYISECACAHMCVRLCVCVCSASMSVRTCLVRACAHNSSHSSGSAAMLVVSRLSIRLEPSLSSSLLLSLPFLSPLSSHSLLTLLFSSSLSLLSPEREARGQMPYRPFWWEIFC